MRLGIDFGTTRIVVSAADRGNYPVLSFEASDNEIRDWFPPLVAVRGAARCFGWTAYQKQSEAGWTLLRSLKRELEGAGAESTIAVDGHEYSILGLITGLAQELRSAILQHSSLALKGEEVLEVMLGVPANANSNQRYLTAEAFRAAGFVVLGMLNEPSAASIEFSHRHKADRKLGAAERVLVYDLGGGTFDASLVETLDDANTVLATSGLARFGGDDFDEILAGLALPKERRDWLMMGERFRLLEECRERKEAVKPTTRRIVLDLDQVSLGLGSVTVAVADFEAACRPLIQESIEVVNRLVKGVSRPFDALYVTGGGSELPLVSRMLREAFGKWVRRSAYTRAATAIGLAIHADAASGYTLRERFGRNFGVWREADHGRRAWFDVIFEKGTMLPLPGAPPMVRERRYYPVHNIGHFRYLEAAEVTSESQPSGAMQYWDEILFPFDPALASGDDLTAVAVEHSGQAQGQQIQERFVCDVNGVVRVELINLTAGYARTYELARWSRKAEPAAKKKRKVAKT